MSTSMHDNHCDTAEPCAMCVETAGETRRPPRTFEDVINEWTAKTLEENQKASNLDTIILVHRLGILGQRLIYEAYAIGQISMLEFMKEQRDGR